MRYVFLIYRDEPDADPTGVQHTLHPGHAATTVRGSAGGVVIADGPAAPEGERLRGVCIAELRDLDDALRTAKALLTSDAGAVEIRPVRTTS